MTRRNGRRSSAIPSQRLRLLWQWVGALLIGAVIYESLTPHPTDIPVVDGDKYGHIVAYGALMFWHSLIYLGRRIRAWWALGFIALGVTLEFCQGTTDYRTFEVADMLADSIGVVGGWLAAPPRLPNPLHLVENRLQAVSNS